MTRELLDRLAADGLLELEFLAHRHTGTVHVIVPAAPAADPQPAVLTVAERLDPDVLLDGLLGVTWTLCGWRGRRNLGGVGMGDDLVSWFPDELLCRSCHRALGPHGAAAFEHPVTAPDRSW